VFDGSVLKPGRKIVETHRVSMLLKFLGSADRAGFAGMTYPSLRHLVADPPSGRDMIHIGACDDGIPSGLAFGMGGDNGDFEVIPPFVSPLHRGQGLGARLVDALADRARRGGYRRLVQFCTIDFDDQRYARYLIRNGWSRPRPIELLCRTDTGRALAMPWLRRARVAEGERIVAWSDVSEAQRRDLLQTKRECPTTYPDELDPFSFEATADAETSVALLRQDRLVGWVLTHRLNDTLLRWTCSFVREDLQGVGRILPLWRAVAERQRQFTAIPEMIWSAPVTMPRMAKFVVRRMRSGLTWLAVASVATRRIDAGLPEREQHA